MSSLELSCRHCRTIINEAFAEWDYATATGRCPTCGRFFDPAREAQASSLKSRPSFRAPSGWSRLVAVSAGVVLLLAAIPGIFLFRLLGLGLAIFGVGSIRYGLKGRTERAREAMQAPTDLSQMAGTRTGGGRTKPV